MSILNALTSGGGITLSGDTSGNVQIQSAGANSAVFNSFGIGLGNTAPTSGLGITFPATQSASSDANTLDDYEEGTFSPAPTPSSGSFGGVTSDGRYTKVGRLVTVSVNILITSVGTATGIINYQVPFAGGGSQQTGSAIETNASGLTGVSWVTSTTGTIRKYDWSGVVIGTSYSWQATVTYMI